MKNRVGGKNFANQLNIKKINTQIKNKIQSPTHFNTRFLYQKYLIIKEKSYKKKFHNNNNYNNNRKIILSNIKKYNTNKEQLYLNYINKLIEGKSSHEKVILKDYNYYNNYSEFLKRYYKYKEIIKIFPKFYTYYKNYFKFFLKPTLSDFYFNNIQKKNGNTLAQLFYERYNNKKEQTANNKNIKNQFYNKKIILTNLIEKNTNISSLNFPKENSTKIFSESSISLLSLINLMNNNTSLNKLEKENDLLKKKINLFFDLKKENKLNNKSQKSTTVLTPTNIHNVKIINEFKKKKPKIKNEENDNNIKNIVSANQNDIVCLSERAIIEKVYNNNTNKFFRDIIQSQKNNIKTFRNNNFISSIKNKVKDNNNNNQINYYTKESAYRPISQEMYQLTTQISNYKFNKNNSMNQTQISKVMKKSPFFRNKIDNNIEKIKSKYVRHDISLNSKQMNTLRNFYRNDSAKSFIYYQKLKYTKKDS